MNPAVITVLKRLSPLLSQIGFVNVRARDWKAEYEAGDFRLVITSDPREPFAVSVALEHKLQNAITGGIPLHWAIRMISPDYWKGHLVGRDLQSAEELESLLNAEFSFLVSHKSELLVWPSEPQARYEAATMRAFERGDPLAAKDILFPDR